VGGEWASKGCATNEFIKFGKRVITNERSGSVGVRSLYTRQGVMTVDCSKFSTLPRIPLTLNNLKLEALFDSGAARSLINANVSLLLKIDKSTLSSMDGFELYDVNEGKLKTLGRCRMAVQFGKGIFPQEFIVTSEISQLCVLGIDAILQHTFVLDGRERVIYRVSKEIENTEAPILTLPAKLIIEPRS
jgi:hypothetical protein